jgi:hypothetical protein
VLGKDEKIRWTDHVRNEEVIHTLKQKRNVLHTTKRRKANWIGHILCRNCPLKHISDKNIGRGTKAMVIQGRKHKQPPDKLKEMTGNWKLKEEALD